MDPQRDNLSVVQSNDAGFGKGASGLPMVANSNDSQPGSISISNNITPSLNSRNFPVNERADDNDELEEEWINKAKTIVEHTKLDPYEQSNQLSKVKATYLKTHYNKDIKATKDEER